MRSEVWLAVPGYEGLYEVSSLGNVRSLFRYKKILKWNVHSRTGYATVQLFKNKIGKRFLVHRLVASAFIPNPHVLPQVNHKDENKLNNEFVNLEWVTADENMKYGSRSERQRRNTDYSNSLRKTIAISNGKKVSRPVAQIKDGAVLAQYDSVKAASKATGLNHAHICECAAGKRYKTVGGYEWKYIRKE